MTKKKVTGSLASDLIAASQEISAANIKLAKASAQLREQLTKPSVIKDIETIRDQIGKLRAKIPEIGDLASSDCGACGACGACVVSPTPDLEVVAIAALAVLD